MKTESEFKAEMANFFAKSMTAAFVSGMFFGAFLTAVSFFINTH